MTRARGTTHAPRNTLHHKTVNSLLLALSLLPRVDAGAEIAHFVGFGPLRGTIQLDLDIEVLRAERWQLSIFTATRSFVRRNTDTESPVRISPQQIWYPVGLRLHWPQGQGRSFGLFAMHQSNHDIDNNDAPLNLETISYEVYGVEYLWPWLRVAGGLYYDRGTRLTGVRQLWPFDYYLAGLQVEGHYTFNDLFYMAGAVHAVFHRGAAHAIPYLNLPAHLDLGLRWTGEGGQARLFMRGQRVEDYLHLQDEPLHLFLLGLALDSRIW